MKSIKLIPAGLFLLFFSNCSDPLSSDNPEWIDELITTFENEPAANPPRSIWQYTYNGEIVYYLPPVCCDQYSTLYDSYGSIICAPDGGISGEGDGRCPDFFQTRINEKLIWEDEREYGTL